MPSPFKLAAALALLVGALVAPVRRWAGAAGSSGAGGAATARWLTTEQITSDPELRAKIDRLAAAPTLACRGELVPGCAGARENVRPPRPTDALEREIFRWYYEVAMTASSEQFGQLAFHESPVVRGYFAAFADRGGSVRAFLPLLLDDACVGLGLGGEQPGELPCVTIRSIAASLLCSQLPFRSSITFVARETIEEALHDPLYASARDDLFASLEHRRPESLRPLVDALLSMHEPRFIALGVRASWGRADEEPRIVRRQAEACRCEDWVDVTTLWTCESTERQDERRQATFEKLLPLLRDDSAEVRLAVVETLPWERATPEQRPALLGAVEDDDPRVRTAARRAAVRTRAVE